MDSLEEYLKENNFDKQLKKLNAKLKNKKIVIYGAGGLFETIIANYDLSKLNIIAISDVKYTEEYNNQEQYGYKTVILTDIEKLNPDYILVATLRNIDIIDNFENKLFKNSKIKIRPLVVKCLWKTLKDIWLS